MSEKLPYTLSEVTKYLLGEGPLDGLYFGEDHPTERGKFWWRKHLRAALTDREARARVCEWKTADFDPGTWQGSCGREEYFMDGGPEMECMDYCPNCGGKVRVLPDDGGSE